MNRYHLNLIQHIEESGKDFLAYVNLLPEGEIRRMPAPGEWSIHATVAHMRDVEENVFLKRLRAILKAPEPPAVEDFDPDRWNREHYEASEPLTKIIADMRRARRQELNLLRNLPDKEWSRRALHPEYGLISIEWLATHNYSHTLEHLHQLLELREKALLRELND